MFFMVFNAIFVAVTGLATAGAITADNVRDERARQECVSQGPTDSAAYTECLRKRGVTVEYQTASKWVK